MDDAAAPKSQATDAGRWRLLAGGAALSPCSSSVLLAVCVALVARSPAAIPAGRCDPDLPVGRGSRSAWNIAGWICRAHFVSGMRRFFGVGRLHLEQSWRRTTALTPWVGLWIGRAPGGGGPSARCSRSSCGAGCAGPFFILSTLAGRRGVVRIAALNWASLTGGAEGFFDPAGRQHRQHGVRVEGHLRRADAGIFCSHLSHHQNRRGARVTATTCSRRRAMTRRPPSAGGASIRLAGAHRRHVPERLPSPASAARCFAQVLPLSRSYPREFSPRAVVPSSRSCPHWAALGTAIGPVARARFVITPLSEMLRSYFRRRRRRALHLAIYGGRARGGDALFP